MPGMVTKIHALTATITSSTLETLIGAPLNPMTKRIQLISLAAEVHYDDGTATAAGSPKLSQLCPLILEGGPGELGALEFIASVTTKKFSCIEEG